jgi:hypothetical protein
MPVDVIARAAQEGQQRLGHHPRRGPGHFMRIRSGTDIRR